VHDSDSDSSSSDDKEEELRNTEAGRVRLQYPGEGEETPPTISLSAGGLLPALEEMGLAENREDKASPEDVD
jgi:hypothetical protein